MNKKVLFVLAEGFEEIEAITPMDLLVRAGIEVEKRGLHTVKVTGSHGISIETEGLLEDFKDSCDGIVFPGGPGANDLASSPLVSQIINKYHNDNKLIAAICASPAKVLSPTGILKGRKATCFPSEESGLQGELVRENVVIDGNVITSRSWGTAVDFAFAIIRYLSGEEAFQKVKASGIVFPD